MMKKWLFGYVSGFAFLQAAVGSIDMQLLAFPVGISLGIAFMAVLFVLDKEQGNSHWMRAFRSPRMACHLLALTALSCAVGGCLPAGTAFSTSWPFVALLVALTAHLSLLVIHRLPAFSWKRDGMFLLVHGGLWLALFSGMAGAGDMEELHVLVGRDQPAVTGISPDGRLKPLGYGLQLQDFTVETNPTDGSPTQYAATVLLDSVPVRLAVNSPYTVSFGEDLYLMSFDREEGTAEAAFCILQVVRQPWKYPLLAGILLLIAGVGGMMKRQK